MGSILSSALLFFISRNSEKHCVLDKVSVVHFKDKLHFLVEHVFVK